jgi:uncharacterized membrane protein YqjE
VKFVAALPRIAPLLARHALGYADLAAEEMAMAWALLRQRVLATVTCVAASSFAILMFCCLVIAVSWDTPQRVTVIALLALTFATAAIIAGQVVRRLRRKSDRLFPRVRNEWVADRELLRQTFATGETRR